MKDTRPIEIQVAELTDEQKMNIKKTYTTQTVISCVFLVCAAVSLIACGMWCMLAYSALGLAADDYFHGSFADDNHSELQDTYYQAQDNVDIAVYGSAATLIVVNGSGVAVLAAYMISSKKKYPYYSEKAYKYLKKHG